MIVLITKYKYESLPIAIFDVPDTTDIVQLFKDYMIEVGVEPPYWEKDGELCCKECTRFGIYDLSDWEDVFVEHLEHDLGFHRLKHTIVKVYEGI